MNPTFSVIIPAGPHTKIAFLTRSLKALFKQKQPVKEILIIADESLKDLLKKNVFKNPKIRIYYNNLNKSEARNFGGKTAKGTHLVHIDVDYILAPTLLSQAAKVIKDDSAKAVICHEMVRAKDLGGKLRKIEKEIALTDTQMAAPQIVEKRIFKRIGGFDESVDELDDWSLMMRLKKENIVVSEIRSPLTFVDEPTDIYPVIKRKFNKGRYLPHFLTVYPESTHTNFGERLTIYTHYFRNNPDKIIFLPLFLSLKCVDTSSFRLGSLFPKVNDPSKMYQKTTVSSHFDEEQMSIYGKLKHYLEIKALNILLEKKDVTTIFEIGAGTGRITEILTENNYKVKPTDVSKEMISVLKQKKHLPRPLLIKTARLPFRNNSFDASIALRVIWHIKNDRTRENLFKEAARISKTYVIMDFAIKDKGLNKFFPSDYFYTMDEIKKLAKKNGLELDTYKKVPLGRYLIRFKKI